MMMILGILYGAMGAFWGTLLTAALHLLGIPAEPIWIVPALFGAVGVGVAIICVGASR